MGHKLQTHDDGPPYEVQDDDHDVIDLMYDHDVDIFAFQAGRYCNGPRCVACGLGKCHHHDPKWWKGPCPQ